ncbi:MAG: DUF1616 domain-containing protein [Haloarcula sp.]
MASHEGGVGRTLLGFADLVLVGTIAAATVLVSLRRPDAVPAPIRVPLGFLFVFVLPGHAVTAALYPAMYGGWEDGFPGLGSRTGGSPLSIAEVIVLTLGLSIAVVPLSVLLVNYSQLAITPATTLGAVATVTLAASAIGILRRHRAPGTYEVGFPARRFLEGAAERTREQLASGPSAEVVTVVVLLLSAGVAGAALSDTHSGESYTEFSLLTVDDETGNLTADDYPSTLAVGEPARLVVSLENNEGERTRYTVVVRLQDVGSTGDDPDIERATTLDRFSLTLGDGEVRDRRTSVAVDDARDARRHRLAFLLYKGDAPGTPTVSNAYRHTHLWVTVAD